MILYIKGNSSFIQRPEKMDTREIFIIAVVKLLEPGTIRAQYTLVKK